MPKLIKGVEKELGGEMRVIPPLSLFHIRRLLPQIQAMQSAGGSMDDKNLELIADTVGSALRRNYPDVTDEQVLQWLDMENFQEVLDAVMTASRLKQAAGSTPGNGNGVQTETT